MVVHTRNPSTWEVEAEELQVYSWLHSEFEASLGHTRFCLRWGVGMGEQKDRGNMVLVWTAFLRKY